jgi:hypothetical protein
MTLHKISQKPVKLHQKQTCQKINITAKNTLTAINQESANLATISSRERIYPSISGSSC